jgi:hypothetical protein
MRRQLVASFAAIAALTTTLAIAQSTPDLGKDLKKGADRITTDVKKQVEKAVEGVTGGQSAGELPPGMDPADMQAYMEAGMPGPMHAHLMKSVGEWSGKTTQWMTPDAPPTMGECVSTVTSIMDGKFVQTSVKGDFSGMPFSGLGINGYDNVSKQFQMTWLDNMGTGMMQGTGTLSADGKTLTWNMNFYCPITKKACVMREVDTMVDENTLKLEMFGPYPKTGKEFKMMEIVFTRKAGARAAADAAKTN